MEEQTRKKPRGMRGNTFAGLLLLAVGGVLLMRQAGYQFPGWMFRWEMILILVGLFIGIRKGFRDFSWLILMLIGFVLLSDNIWPDMSLKQYLIPAIIILLGLFFLFAPKRLQHHGPCRRRYGKSGGRPLENRDPGRPDQPGTASAGPSGTPPDTIGGSTDSAGEPVHPPSGSFAATGPGAGESESADTRTKKTSEPIVEFSFSLEKEPSEFQPTHEAYTDIVSIFSGIKKTILSKQFTGGEIVCVFGGAELNLTNADFTSPVELDLVQIFGGTKLIVPANWEIRPEAATIFGGIDDKRRQPPNTRADKVLILKGTIIFGGVEVSSY